MNRIKFAITLVFVAGLVGSLAGQTFGYPPFVAKSRKFGATDCTFCHVDPEGGAPWNERGQWLMAEKERRKADAVDPEWLVDYKPAQATAGAKPAETGTKTETTQAPANAVEQELLKLSREWIEAAGRQDKTTLDRILAADFIATDEQGRTINKAAYLAETEGLKVDSYTFTDVSMRVYGDTAVVSLLMPFKGSYKGQDISGSYRETDVWVKRDNRWQAVASHVSRLASK
ncbi:MAG TPA: DUF4440 domain-containing protein [Blastocatellia bacterium]|nr:DUF4440 domain-containing protein [Blastocatellia bacterium]